MPKHPSLTLGEQFILFLVSGGPFAASVTNCITWSPFDPFVHLYALLYWAVASYVWRLFLFPDERRSITWFDFLIGNGPGTLLCLGCRVFDQLSEIISRALSIQLCFL